MTAAQQLFNGRPLVDELRRLSRKNPGYSCTAMQIAADAIESGNQPSLNGRSLIDALHLSVRYTIGDSKAAIRTAIQALSASRGMQS